MNDAPRSIRIAIDAMACDGHALCVAVAPQVFEMGDDERAHVIDVAITDALRPSVLEAARVCPCQAIEVDEEG
jgi:ferredoxin